MKITLFGKTKAIEATIDEFLNNISDCGLLFEQLIKHFIDHGADDIFTDKVERLRELEKKSSELASQIGRALYTEMLIPDLRGDVLSLVQDMDYLVELYAQIAVSFDIERPDHSNSPEGGHRLYEELLENAVKCVEATVLSARAFFKDITAVTDNTHKVSFYENEVDELALRLKKEIFNAELPLEVKMHFRDFVDVLDDLADEAEDVAEWISIYAIKRSL